MPVIRNSVTILGNRIDCFKDYETLYEYILNEKVNRGLQGYVTVNNTHTMMEGFWNSQYQDIINSSYLSIPDGKPLQ
ncbi:MAG: hypothetical protein J7497_10790, partial [Chitinophagaceae bacterium]|nr:hypothetical protein [Chitinophagaceae bacterium]